MPSSDLQSTEPAWIFANEDFKSIIASFSGAQSFAYHKGTRIILVLGKSRSTSANINRRSANVIRRLEEVYLSSSGPSVHFWEHYIEDLLQTLTGLQQRKSLLRPLHKHKKKMILLQNLRSHFYPYFQPCVSYIKRRHLLKHFCVHRNCFKM